MKLYALFSRGARGNCLTHLAQYPPLLVLGTRGGLARREFASFPVVRSTVGRSSNLLGCLKTNFKKLTNDQEYEPVPYVMVSQLFFSNSIFV